MPEARATAVPRHKDNDYTNEAAAERRAFVESLTGVDPGDDPIVLPPLVTVLGRKSGGE